MRRHKETRIARNAMVVCEPLPNQDIHNSITFSLLAVTDIYIYLDTVESNFEKVLHSDEPHQRLYYRLILRSEERRERERERVT